MSRYYNQPKGGAWDTAAWIAVFIAITFFVMSNRAEAAEQVAVTDAGPALVEVAPNIWSTDTERLTARPVSPSQRKCISTWRAIHYAAHAADAATTLIGASKGATEANPVARVLLGKKPSAVGLLAFKAAGIGLAEWQVSRALNRLDGKGACRVHKVGAIITGSIAALNLRVMF